MSRRYFYAVLLVTALVLPAEGALAQAGPFSEAQVVAGRKSFQDYCAACHGDNLAGGGEAPALTGAIFSHDWATQNVGAFFAFISNAMPQGLEGSLKPEEYAAITAFIMAANGAKPGTASFTGKSDVKISAIANGKLVAAVVK